LLLTLIPLVVSAAFMMKSINDVQSDVISKAFAFILPFAPPTVLSYFSTFFDNAQKIKGIGIGVLIIMTVGLFSIVEDSLNTIWKVSRSRSFFIRLRTFTMMIVYSPILFLASSQMRRMFQIQTPDLTLLSSLLPFLLSVLGFSSLIFFVPNIKVKYMPALLGGLLAGLLFELERRGFNTYVALSMQTQTIYGTFGILSFFLISLFFVSLIMLFGAQFAYVYQNFRPLLRAKKRWDRRVGDYRTYITLRIMTDCVSAFMKKKPAPTLSFLANLYELTDSQAQGLLKWLIHEGFLHNISNKDAYVPTRDFSKTPVKNIVDTIEDQSRKIPSTPDDFTKTCLATLILNHHSDIEPTLTFAALIDYIDIEGNKAAKLAESIVNK
jgi:membrane protein